MPPNIHQKSKTRPALPYVLTLALGLMPVVALADGSPAASAPQPEKSSALSSAFSDAQKAAIEDIVRALLTTKEPDLVFKAVAEERRRQEAQAESKRQAAFAADHDQLFGDSFTPAGGNPNGSITVVEFFDYQCAYCKASADAVTQLLKTNKNVKLIYKEYPILGPESVKGSLAALASARQGKYPEFHDALLATKGHLSDDIIFKTAEDSGLDVARLKADMADPSIRKEIDANVALGGEVGARGTPTFFFGDQLFGGAMKFEQMQQAVDDAQKKQKG